MLIVDTIQSALFIKPVDTHIDIVRTPLSANIVISPQPRDDVSAF